MIIVNNKPLSMPLEMISCQWGWMLCPPGDQFVTGSLRMWGVYSETEVKIIKQLAADKRTLIIGGNIGAVAAPVSQVAEYTEVYEPQPIISQVLGLNMALAGSDNYQVHNAAVGAEDSFIRVPSVKFDADCNMGRIGKEHWGKGEEVSLVNINNVLSYGFDFMLIDAEGMELEILQAVEDTSLLPNLMWIECDREDTGAELIQHIIDLGYQPYWMVNPLTPNSVDPTLGPWNLQSSFNLLCVKQPALFPIPNIPQFPAKPTDTIGNCPVEMLIWNVQDESL